MKIFIINLLSSADRRERVKKVLEEKGIFNYEIIVAVDGRKMSAEQKRLAFDQEKALKRYGRVCRDGEIGCTLSHQKCYKKMIDEEIDAALILEDDIILNADFSNIISILYKLVETEIPTVILLSNNYWYYKRTRLVDKYSQVTVFDAYATYSYLINNSAAEKAWESRPFTLADDWKYIKGKNIVLKACFPHLVDPHPDILSVIFEDNKSRGVNKDNMLLMHRIYMYWVGGVKKILAFMGKCEKP